MSSRPQTFAADVVDRPARDQLELFLDGLTVSSVFRTEPSLLALLGPGHRSHVIELQINVIRMVAYVPYGSARTNP